MLNIFELYKYKVMLFMFKYMKGLSPVILKRNIKTKTNDDCHPNTSRRGNHFCPLRHRKSAGQNSMKYNGAVLWNSIVNLIRVVLIL